MAIITRPDALALAFGVVTILSASPAAAGVIDSPRPVLTVGGTTSRHVFTIPGVIKNNSLETIFVCTSLDSINSFRFAVEVFAATGGAPLNDAATPALEGAATLSPGETQTVGTSNTVGIHEDKILNLDPASLRNGSARIVSESTRITCTAFVVDEINDPPATSYTLKVIKAKKQSGD